MLETDAPDGLPKFDNSMSSLLHAVRRNPHASQNDLENQSQSEDTNDATDEQSLPEEKLNHPANIRAVSFFCRKKTQRRMFLYFYHDFDMKICIM